MSVNDVWPIKEDMTNDIIKVFLKFNSKNNHPLLPVYNWKQLKEPLNRKHTGP